MYTNFFCLIVFDNCHASGGCGGKGRGRIGWGLFVHDLVSVAQLNVQLMSICYCSSSLLLLFFLFWRKGEGGGEGSGSRLR